MNKHLWSARIIYTIEYETGFFKKTTKRTVETREIDDVFYVDLGICDKVREYSNYYKTEFVPYLFEFPDYKIVEKRIDPFIVKDATFDYLKNHMIASEFIEYVHNTWNSLDKLVG